MTTTLLVPPATSPERGAPDEPPSTTPVPPAGRLRWRRLWTGPAPDPRWARPLLLALLAATAVLYLSNLSNSGYANEFYAAAVKSGTESWKAWLFGSLDSANSITVDKPPASLWLMVLSARIFGFSSFAMLLPQALLGVGTVGITYAAVKRWSGPAAGLAAGTLIALTPVAALMFRFNNPDAALVFLMALAGYFTTRAIEGKHALRWLVLAGTAVGFAFLTKMFQGLLVLPGFGLAYLVAGQPKLGKRLAHLAAATGAVIVSAGWFVALVALWPASSRPYIGGSTDNSLWELAIGYNGLSRIFGGQGNGGGGGGANFGGSTGLTRMFGTSFGAEISWLLPAALVSLLAGFWFTRRAPRTDRVRASLILRGGWLLVTALVLSYMSGTVHPYYSVALAPAIAAVIAIAGRELWRGRASHLARSTLAVMIAITGAWGYTMLNTHAATWLPWLRWVVLIGSMVGAALLAISAGALKKFAVAGLLIGSISALGATGAYTVATVSVAHTGSTPSSGPSGSAGSGFGGGGFGDGAPGGTLPSGSTGGTTGSASSTTGSTAATTGSGSTTRTGGMGGSGSADSELVALLDKTTTTWSAAVVGSQTADVYILATDTAVMPIGGFTGSDNSPTLAQFEQYVSEGKITYFISGGGMGGGGGGGSSSSASQITAWVEAHFTATTVGGVTVYDLTTQTI